MANEPYYSALAAPKLIHNNSNSEVLEDPWKDDPKILIMIPPSERCLLDIKLSDRYLIGIDPEVFFFWAIAILLVRFFNSMA